MCVHVRYSSAQLRPVYDSATRTITIPDSVDPSLTAIAVRAVLAELAAPQPEFGALCWCGEPIIITPRIPIQRRSAQVNHGA
ncbi:hypothetical protein GCM10010381_27330 [Streptomyces xantholiticus]|nr:hypothetical protein GCM10010381_27330 [Streptomyces xantholiticus]